MEREVKNDTDIESDELSAKPETTEQYTIYMLWGNSIKHQEI